PEQAKAPLPSIAVLPLQNIGKEESAYFCDGIHEEVITQLSKIRSLKITSRTSVLPFRNTDKPLKDIADLLNVDYLLEGSVRQAGERVRVTAQLISAADDAHLFAESYDRTLTLESLLEIQMDISLQIARSLEAELTSDEESKLASLPTQSLEAYDTYLLAKYRAMQLPTRDQFPGIIKLFERAIELDPQFVEAYLGLGWMYSYIGSAQETIITMEPLQKAGELANKALAIDSSHAGAREMAANVRYWTTWNPDVEMTYRDILHRHPMWELNYNSYAQFLATRRRFEEAIDIGERYIELAPNNTFALLTTALRYQDARRYDKSIELAEHYLALDPSSHQSVYLLGLSHCFRGDPETAIPLMQRTGTAWLGYAYAKAGRIEEAQAELSRIEESGKDLPVGPELMLMHLNLGLGNTEQAFTHLNKAIDQRAPGVLYFHVLPSVDGIRDDPRFQQVLSDLSIPEADWAVPGPTR
ncbi:MAG: tetratricopeptide repeat protein, partial [Gammaproteobacteria bacterium]|nr:tetratricopeptide repeat protein [Gammaproteobacteria bacterium]